MRTISKEAQDALAAASATAEQCFSSMDTVKAFAAEKEESDRCFAAEHIAYQSLCFVVHIW